MSTFTSPGKESLSSTSSRRQRTRSLSRISNFVPPNTLEQRSPLADSDFNNSKSNIKCLEYCALGIPVIASNVIPYRGTIGDSIKGILIDNTIDDWVNGILHYYSQSNLSF
jgi:glycosyltransferase involved in cell wall biosynthesis